MCLARINRSRASTVSPALLALSPPLSPRKALELLLLDLLSPGLDCAQFQEIKSIIEHRACSTLGLEGQ